MKKFWELFQSSVITQSFITIAVIVCWLVLVGLGRPYPETLETIVYIVVGFFFGSKYQQAMSQPMIDVAKEVMKNLSTEIAKAAKNVEPKDVN